MVYNSRTGGRYDAGSYGTGSAGYARRDTSLRRGDTFGSLDMPASRSLSTSRPLPTLRQLPTSRPLESRQSYGSASSVSPWASGEGPSRNSWGGSSGTGGGGGGGGMGSVSSGRSGGPDLFAHLGPVSGGGGGVSGAQSRETLNMAASLVSALLQQNQEQQQRQQRQQSAPQPFGPSRPEPMPFGGDGYGGGGSAPRGMTGYRGVRTGFGRTEYNQRPEFASKFDRRDTFVAPTRGRTPFRGRVLRGGRAATFPARGTGVRRVDTKPLTDKAAVGRKRTEPKKGIKTTQEAIDEAKAAALEKAMEKEAEKKKAEGGDAPELMAKGEEAATTEPAKDGEKAAESKDADTDKTADGKDAAATKPDAATKTADAKDASATKPADGKDSAAAKTVDKKVDKKTPVKPQHEKIDSKYLTCSICCVANVGNEQGFQEHVRGRKHHAMMEMVEQKLEQTAKMIRIEIQVAAKRAELDRMRRGPKGNANIKEQGFCGMCNIRLFEDPNEHRISNALHIKLKLFLHPRCCNLRFDTPVMYERHLLSFTHFRKEQARDKEREAAGAGTIAVEGEVQPAATEAAKENGDVETDGAEPADGATAAKDSAPAPADGQPAAVQPDKADEPMEVEELTPQLYDGEVAVATRAGQPFSGTFCTLCHVAMPVEQWLPHCRTRMHYNRHVVERQAAERARREAVDDSEDQVVVVVEGVDDTSAEGAEKRGVKRAADDEQGGEAKIMATEKEGEPAVDVAAPAVAAAATDDHDGATATATATADAAKVKSETADGAEAAEKPAVVKAEKPATEAAATPPAKPVAEPVKPAAAAAATPVRNGAQVAKAATPAARQQDVRRGSPRGFRRGRGGRGRR